MPVAGKGPISSHSLLLYRWCRGVLPHSATTQRNKQTLPCRAALSRANGCPSNRCVVSSPVGSNDRAYSGDTLGPLDRRQMCSPPTRGILRPITRQPGRRCRHLSQALLRIGERTNASANKRTPLTARGPAQVVSASPPLRQQAGRMTACEARRTHALWAIPYRSRSWR